MIEDMLGELAPIVETTKVRGAAKEDRSSSTPWKDDREKDNTVHEELAANAPEKQTKHQVVVGDEEQGQLRLTRACKKEIIERRQSQ